MTIIVLGVFVGVNLEKLKLNPTTIVHYMEQWGSGAVFIFLGLYLGLTLIGAPAIPLTIAGGIFFGFWWGTILSILGATLGAIATFSLTRSWLKRWVQKWFGQHHGLIRFNRAATRIPFRFVLFIRLMPVFPFNLSNFLLGLTPIGYCPYILGTLMGIIPGTLTYTWLGVTGKNALNRGDYGSILLSLGIGFLFCCLPMLKKYNQQL